MCESQGVTPFGQDPGSPESEKTEKFLTTVSARAFGEAPWLSREYFCVHTSTGRALDASVGCDALRHQPTSVRRTCCGRGRARREVYEFELT